MAEAQGSVVDRFDSRACYPIVDVVDVEPQEVAPFHVWDASFEHEPAHVTDRDAQVLGDLLDRNESGEFMAYLRGSSVGELCWWRLHGEDVEPVMSRIATRFAC